ncbi:MAG: hypothetical protein ABJC79_02015 [Acidimicrobiia bacterium]
MTALRLQISDTIVYEGPAIALPRAGEEILHNGEIVRVQALVWDFGGDATQTGVVTVSLTVGSQPYTF